MASIEWQAKCNFCEMYVKACLLPLFGGNMITCKIDRLCLFQHKHTSLKEELSKKKKNFNYHILGPLSCGIDDFGFRGP